MRQFKEIIREKIPLLFDGATGTELYNRGIFINRCFEDANLSNASLVTELHRQYLRAGAQVLTSNSWGANRLKLAAHNLQDQVYEINCKAAELAKGVAGNEAYVAGSVGPLGVRIEPWGPTSFSEAKDLFKEQIKGLIAGGADVISLETFDDISEIRQAIEACHEVNSEIPIIAHMVINMDGKLPAGSPIEWAIKELGRFKVDGIGLNCSVGPGPMLSAVEKIRAVTNLPISLQPNAGLPKQVDGRTIYMCTPEYMGEFAKNFLQSDVQFIGGCCGTSPEHIRAMANAIRHRTAMVANENLYLDQKKPAVVVTSNNGETEKTATRVPAREKSVWARKIADGERVYACELLPPAGVKADDILKKSSILKAAGVDVVNIPDGPRASARMSAILTAVLVEQKVGIETVLHYTCRDRNLLGMQSDFLGGHAVGLRNFLLVTGDPPKTGSYPNATGVYDVDAIGLTNMVHRLNGGIDLGGRSIGEPTAISLGVGVNPVHRDVDYEMKRFKYKVEAGAEWAITQPVFDISALFKFLEFIDKNNLRIPIIAGIWPLVSYRNALFMNNEVPGVVIPDDVMKAMEKTTSPEDARKLGAEIAHNMVEELGDAVQGIQISAPFGRIDLAMSVIDKEMPKA